MFVHRWQCANCRWVNRVPWLVGEILTVIGAAMLGVIAFYFLAS